MAHIVLARKWRPRNFKQVLGQIHVVRALQNSIAKGTLGHAFLFTGTRGVGKTSLARILAKAVNCTEKEVSLRPCLECSNCQSIEAGHFLDVLEVDAASNNGVDQMRDLIDNAQFLPAAGGVKVYIIDEVHMLSMSAFNALLKLLEEPPAHVLFILATTEIDKVPSTIQSRCQRFDFKEFTVAQIEEQLRNICKAEGIKIESDLAMKDLAELARGSARDSLSLLEQVLGVSGKSIIDEESVMLGVGVPGRRLITELLSTVVCGDISGLKLSYEKCVSRSFQISQLALAILRQLFDLVRNQELSVIGLQQGDVDSAELFWIYQELDRGFVEVSKSLSPERSLLILLMKIATRRQLLRPNKIEKIEKVENVPMSQPTSSMTKVDMATTEAPTVETISTSELSKVPLAVTAQKSWDGFLDFLLKTTPATAANLEQGNLINDLSAESERVMLKVGFGPEAQIFYDYLNSPEVKIKVKAKAQDYFEKSAEAIDIQFVLLGEKDKEEQNFVSKADQLRKKKDDILEERKSNLLNHPMAQGVEKIFNVKIDKVMVNNEDTN